MTIRATLCIDDAVGEHRRALLDPFGLPFRLDIERWSERGRRAKLGEVRWGRARARLPGANGWFVDLGLDRDGVIEATRSTAIVEGALIPVRVKSEAWAEKGPALSLADMPAATPRPERPGLHAHPPQDPFRAGVEVVATIEGVPARRYIDTALQEAVLDEVPIPDGGNLAIERTRALTAIDIDGGARRGHEGATFARDLNLAAAEEAARQIGLRNLGGLVVVDFLTMASRKDRAGVVAAYRNALAACLGRTSDVAEISALGLCEASLARRARPTADAIGTAAPGEREALDALRMLESEGVTARGARLRAAVSGACARWLEADTIGWQAALGDRIGRRWTIEADNRPAGQSRVWSVR